MHRRIPSHFTEWKYGTQSTESTAGGAEAGREGVGGGWRECRWNSLRKRSLSFPLDLSPGNRPAPHAAVYPARAERSSSHFDSPVHTLSIFMLLHLFFPSFLPSRFNSLQLHPLLEQDDPKDKTALTGSSCRFWLFSVIIILQTLRLLNLDAILYWGYFFQLMHNVEHTRFFLFFFLKR